MVRSNPRSPRRRLANVMPWSRPPHISSSLVQPTRLETSIANGSEYPQLHLRRSSHLRRTALVWSADVGDNRTVEALRLDYRRIASYPRKLRLVRPY